jgi:hypothetical protein
MPSSVGITTGESSNTFTAGSIESSIATTLEERMYPDASARKLDLAEEFDFNYESISKTLTFQCTEAPVPSILIDEACGTASALNEVMNEREKDSEKKGQDQDNETVLHSRKILYVNRVQQLVIMTLR